MNRETKIENGVTERMPPAGFVRRRRREHRDGTRQVLARLVASHDDNPMLTWMWVGGGILAGLEYFSANSLLASFAVLLLPAFMQLLWRKGETPVMVVGCLVQWLQVTVVIFYMNHYGQTLEEAAGRHEFPEAAWLSLTGILVLAVGFRLVVNSKCISVAAQVEQEIAELSLPRLFNLWVAAFAVSAAAGVVLFAVPGLSQLFGGLTSLQWVFIFLLALAVLQRKKGYGFLLVAVLVSFGSGLLSYFSGFKTVLFVVALALMTARSKITWQRLVLLGLVASIALLTSIVWTAIKPEYRDFMNRGSGQQEVVVSVGEQVDKLKDLIDGLDSEKIKDGMDQLMLRVAYLNYFAASIGNVPAGIPYAGGDLWLGSVKHVFMPRILFPNKAVLDDSARTTYYTGITVAQAEEGASIGIGYMGESYIDFGPRLMFVPILLLGVFYGWIYRYFVFNTPSRALGMSIAVAILFPVLSSFAESNVKIVGGNVSLCLVMFGLSRFFGRPVMTWLKGGRDYGTTRQRTTRPLNQKT